MIDRGLVLSVAAVVAAVALAAWRWPTRVERKGSLFATVSPADVVGVIVARLVAVALDDPFAFSRLRDLLILRGGMEFWPGVAAGVAVAAVAARRSGAAVVAKLADLAPYALVAYGAYEAACLLRDGCFGPVSGFGLRPGGLGPAELPIGLIVAVAVGGLALVVRRLGGRRDALALLAAVLGVGAVRSVAAVWLPRIGQAPSRPQLESIVVSAFAAVTLGWLLVTRRPGRGSPPSSRPRRGSVDPDAAAAESPKANTPGP